MAMQRTALASAARMSGSGHRSLRFASTFRQGPAKVETEPQASEHRGKTTQKVLPVTAGLMAFGAFAWLFTSYNKKDVVPTRVHTSGTEKLKSGAVKRAEEQLAKGE